jgi:hypothetical protein
VSGITIEIGHFSPARLHAVFRQGGGWLYGRREATSTVVQPLRLVKVAFHPSGLSLCLPASIHRLLSYKKLMAYAWPKPSSTTRRLALGFFSPCSHKCW